jgi:hypothetical protein
MTRLENVRHLEAAFVDSKADLYSSDLGVSAAADFNNQEGLNAHPHLGQDLAGLLTLRPGGHFVVKHYTFFEVRV